MCIFSALTAGSTLAVTSTTTAASGTAAAIATGVSIASTIASVIFSGVSAGQQADLATEQGKRQATVAKHNASLADAKSLHARKRGEAEGSRVATRAGRFAKRQRALAAAGGLDPTTGTAGHSIDDTKVLGKRDAQIAASAGMSDAAGFTAQAFNERARAAIVGVSASPAMQIAGSVAGGAASVASTWYKYRADDNSALFGGRRGVETMWI